MHTQLRFIFNFKLNYFLEETSFFPLCKIFSRIFSVMRYVGFTPVSPKPPEERVLPVSKGLSEA